MRKSSSATTFAARLLGLGLLLGLQTPARLAHAQAARGERIQHVEFVDDLLNADLGAPFGARVFPAHLPPARTMLIRPRTNFIPELYKSVEHL